MSKFRWLNQETLNQLPFSLPWKIEVVEQTGSTNADLAARVRAGGCPDYTVLVTTDQCGGRGRLARTWTAPADTAVAMSMAVPLKPFEGHWGLLPLVMGSAVAGALFDWGVKAKLKWPNDVYIGDKKVCGILGEFVGGTAVIGCGINVAQTQETIGYETATSLAMTGVHVTHDEVVSRVLDHFGRALDVMTTEDGPALLRDFYRASSMTLGQQVRIYHDEDSYVEGLAIDISDDGQLLIDIDGEVQSFASGDVYHLRSQDRGD